MEYSSMYKKGNTKGMCNGVYGFAVLGAAVYFIQHATTFWMGIFGIGKAIFWPAMYKVLGMLGM